VGTRQNYVVAFTRPPRLSPAAKMIQIDIDPTEIGRNRVPDCGITGDATAVLAQLVEARDGRFHAERRDPWISRLAAEDEEKRAELERRMSAGGRPIHPLRLCREIRDFVPRDAVLCVDGQEILNYARSAIPFYAPHSLNSGPYGCMGVGLPFGLGAKAAMPEKLVVVLHGDGSFGLNAMELDTALRHRLPVVCVISNNGGWTATDRFKVGRDLGFTRYDLMFGAIGCHAEYVEEPDDIRPALGRAAASGRPAVVNVRTDPTARAQTQRYADYST
jgi:acetolactate synthase-1/2/3 large subunit